MLTILLFISGCLSNSSKQLTNNEGTLTVGVVPYVVPLSYYENGKLTGFEIDYANYLGNKLNLKVEFVPYEFKDILNAVENKEVDIAISCITITPERKKRVHFSRPYLKTGSVVAVFSTEEVSDISDFDGKKIGVLKGSVHENYALEFKKVRNIEVITYNTQSSLINGLKSNEVYAVIIDKIYLDSLKNDIPIKEAIVLDVQYIGIASKLNTPILENINQVILELEEDGTYKLLHEKWFQ
ncbi:extracellular solute-binding protein family 3 [Methanococcus vannielii SB]|uniref:Extracellular solute-binding protein family 3 n=1 Tax=Methanococcus vannielii (strain ATCC 35089 / DSM 1224 / JCM 13029 / OCM 148 / SB) TaxID=406327 RepID=A6UNX0_METVS|nr:ABC transporter substrate-binding protein [Methanococcus vannielii]ABR54192.1 extracellular solute-binding protein family 3 [Methanococcus vannielii SB]